MTDSFDPNTVTPQLRIFYDSNEASRIRLFIELTKRNEWLEEVVAQAQEHYHIDLSDEGWPRWEGAE